MNSFNFDGTSSAAFSMKIYKKNIYSGPERSQEIVAVPGRDGDLIFDNGNYNNIEVSYSCDFRYIEENASQIKNWLCKAGYKRLTDTYDTTSFRQAAFIGPLNISEAIKNVGSAEIKFNCKPYKYLNSGETSVTLNTSTTAKTINNAESYSSLPLFEITASKQITLQITNSAGSTSRTITFPSTSKKLYIDSELMAVYDDSMTLYNDVIDFVEFPTFKPGNNSIKFTKGTGATLTSASVKPRWRKL